MPNQTSHLRLNNLVFWGRHGHFPFERESGNRFEVDIDLEADLANAVKQDDLSLSVDLAAVFDIVSAHVEGEPCSLIETLADRIAAEVIGMSNVLSATVRIRKLSPPLPGSVGGIIEAEINRVR
ncbi:dihydroneopterin aldolase [bacterium]|nr:dihydroneopterin aldolase [bacterium]MBU1652700.1 dihydroneopterin aldolase [bacterium]MBU1881600.1 dihydroneopterin aldolase [bacterium]